DRRDGEARAEPGEQRLGPEVVDRHDRRRRRDLRSDASARDERVQASVARGLDAGDGGRPAVPTPELRDHLGVAAVYAAHPLARRLETRAERPTDPRGP